MTSAASPEPRFVQPYRYRPIGNFRDAALGQLRLDTPSMQSDLSSGTLYKPCLSDGSRCATPSQIGEKPRFHCFFSRLLLWFLKTLSARTETRGELPGRANAVDFESGKRRRDGYTALFLSRSTRRQRDASLRDRTQRTADGFFDCLG